MPTSIAPLRTGPGKKDRDRLRRLRACQVRAVGKDTHHPAGESTHCPGVLGWATLLDPRDLGGFLAELSIAAGGDDLPALAAVERVIADWRPSEGSRQ
jgi:hypothetical protein